MIFETQVYQKGMFFRHPKQGRTYIDDILRKTQEKEPGMDVKTYLFGIPLVKKPGVQACFSGRPIRELEKHTSKVYLYNLDNIYSVLKSYMLSPNCLFFSF